MALPNPMAIDEAAIHRASQIRLMAYAAVVGQEGVLGNDHLRVVAKGTPGAAIDALPGGYSVLARHLGGDYEAYVGKFTEAESAQVSPTDSSGSRTDLVVLRIENPFVSGSGVWTHPADPLNGPYAFIRVIENVGPNTNSVRSISGNYSAITLAKITRGPNKGVVEQGDITELRSLAELGGTRTIVEQVDAPPIAQSSYVQFNPSEVDPNYNQGGSDSKHDYFTADNTNWQNWPDAAVWSVPVPEWAREMDVDCQVYNAQILNWDVFGQLAISVDGSRQEAQTFAIDYVSQPGRHTIPYGKTLAVPSSWRGKVVTMRLQAKSNYVHDGELDAKSGTVTKLHVNFQRYPS